MNPSEKDYSKLLDLFKREYVFTSKARIKVWHTWLAVGLTLGFVLGVGLVVQRGQFEFSAAAGEAFYVATNGDDSRSCATAENISTPKRTIASGLACLSAGKTLYLRGGTYPEVINSNNQTIPVGTSWTSAVTIASYPGESAILRPSSDTILNLARSHLINGPPESDSLPRPDRSTLGDKNEAAGAAADEQPGNS